ncbi:MAG TPA: hypothetical protein PKM50_04235 [Methanoregula sp.]|nr:hypothetical protein [Methanoregula sp.]
MLKSECPGLTRAEEKQLKLAVEGKCELCRDYFPFPDLVIHRISRRLYREMVRDPSARILIVCHLCHEHIHRLPMKVKAQRAIVSRRSFFVRQDLRRILGYTAKPYHPPKKTGIAQMYEEYFFHFPPGSFRLGG